MKELSKVELKSTTVLDISKKMSVSEIFLLFMDLPKNLSSTENKLRALLSLAPWGGFIDKLLFYNRDKVEVEKIKDFLIDLSNEVSKLAKNKIDKTFLESEEFYYLLKNALEKIRFERLVEKGKLFRNFVINSLNPSARTVNLTYYFDKLDNLEMSHFGIIEWYYKNNYTSGGIGSEYDNCKKRELPKISSIYVQLENDLSALGFLSMVQVDAYQNHRYMLSPTGKFLFEFVQHEEV